MAAANLLISAIAKRHKSLEVGLEDWNGMGTVGGVICHLKDQMRNGVHKLI